MQLLCHTWVARWSALKTALQRGFHTTAATNCRPWRQSCRAVWRHGTVGQPINRPSAGGPVSPDRKRVVEGQGVSDRVDLGGSRHSKKKQQSDRRLSITYT